MEPIAAKFLVVATLAALVPPWPQRVIRRSVPLAPGSEVFLRLARGVVEVQTGDQSIVEIEARIQPRTPLGLSRACLDGTRLEVDSSPHWLRIATVTDSGEEPLPWREALLAGRCAQPPAIDYRILLPRTARLTVRPAARQ